MTVDNDPILSLSGRFEDIEFIGNSLILLGLPFDAPEEFKRMVWAAAQCYIAGNKSIDHFYRRYGDIVQFPRPTDNRRQLSSTLRRCSYEIQRIAGQLSNNVERQSTVGLFASESALLRLPVSFEYSAFLLMQGAIYESAAVLRLCLEQIAWAFDVHALDDERLFRTNPIKSLTKLKELEPSCGRLYSLLSDYTHIHPRLQQGYIDLSGEYAAVRYRDHDLALQMSSLYIKIVNLYVRTAEKISYEYFDNLKAWQLEPSGALTPITGYSCTNTLQGFANASESKA